MPQRVRTLIKGKLYLRDRDLSKVVEDTDDIIRAYRVRSYDEGYCRACPYLEERFSKKYCGVCEHYKGRIDLAERINIQGKEYISFPLGSKQDVEKRLDVKLKVPEGFDLRKYPQMKKKYKVIVDLYDGSPGPDGTTRINQQKTVEDFLSGEDNLGVIQAGARSGKTVLGVAISIELGLKTLVIANNDTLLGQFWDTYCGDGSKRVRASNIPANRVVIIRKITDFLKPHDVALVTYQKFIRKDADERINTFIKGKYGLLIGDEIHNAAAQAYASFLLKLDIPLRLGLSATPKRKDKRYHIAEAVYGPVIIKLDKVGMKPLIKVHRTGRFAGNSARAWHTLSKLFVVDKIRNTQIVDEAYSAIERGHKAVLIALDQTEHIEQITEMLNARSAEEHRHNRNLPELRAMAVDGRIPIGKPREAKYEQFDEEDSPWQFLVAQRKLVKEGIDLKRPSCVICPIPMSADPKEGAPLFEQLSYRGSTAVAGKRQPEVIVFADDSVVIERMINGLLRWEVLKNDIERVGDKRGLYYVDDSCRKFMKTSSAPDTVAESRLGKVMIRR